MRHHVLVILGLCVFALSGCAGLQTSKNKVAVAESQGESLPPLPENLFPSAASGYQPQPPPVAGESGYGEAARIIANRGDAMVRSAFRTVPAMARKTGVILTRGKIRRADGQQEAKFASSKPSTLPSGGVRDMSWPLRGRISRGFSGGGGHRGLDICAEEGTPISAARCGRVVYSGCGFSGYGNMIIIDHGAGVSTIYGHNRRNLACTGQLVNAGEQIAEVGQTGRATTPHCHFEVRTANGVVDPASLLR